MNFEWDEAKSDATAGTRGFDFAYASTVFLDENRIEEPGRTVKGEDRSCVIGLATGDVLLLVVYTWRTYEDETVCRIISGRKAGKKEHGRYKALREIARSEGAIRPA